jgi:intracellular multiplication protein IcmB
MSLFTTLAKYVGAVFNTSTDQYIDIEIPTPDNMDWFTKSGSIFGVIEIKGHKSVVGFDEFYEATKNLSDGIRAILDSGNYDFQFVFERDKDYTKREMKRIYSGHKATAARLNLDIDDMIEEEEDLMADLCVYESAYLVVWTQPSVSPTDIPNAVEDKDPVKALKELDLINSDGVTLFHKQLALHDKHTIMMNKVVQILQACNIEIERLNASAALTAMFGQTEKHMTYEHVKLATFNTNETRYVPSRFDVSQSMNDYSDLILPRFDLQLARTPHSAQDLDGRPLPRGLVRVGQVIYCPSVVNTFPRKLTRFSQLFTKINDNVPYRLSFRITNNKPSLDYLKGILVSVLSWVSDRTKEIKTHREFMSNYVSEGGLEVEVQVSITTWGKSLQEVESRESTIKACLMQWDGATADRYFPDPTYAFFGGCLGVSSKQPGPAFFPPIADIVYHLPIARPGNVWNSGCVVAKTTCGKVWCYEPNTALQESNNQLIIARPRMGKSVLSNSINTSLCLKRGLVRLPMITVLDIGTSSVGAGLTIKEGLPEDQKHQVFYYKPQMSKTSKKVNIFDLELGCDYPLPFERDNIKNFLDTICTEPGAPSSKEGMPDLINAVIDAAYKRCAERLTSKQYMYGVNDEIDITLKKLAYDIERRSSWRDVRDFLFDHNEIRLATIAQRYSVPILEDLADIAYSDDQIQANFGPNSGSNLILYFNRKIQSALTDFILYNGVTELDFANARIIIFDIQDIAVQGDSPDSIRKNAISYIMFTYFGTKHFFLTEEAIPAFPQKYQAYQAKRISEIREDEKRIVCDEAHRAKSQGVQRMFSIFQREGGKWGVQICLISHSIEDFDPQIVKQSNTFFFLGSMSANEINAIDKFIKLTPSERHIMESSVLHGPKMGGSSMMMRFVTVDGTYSQVLRFPRGKKLMWALSTTMVDMSLRSLVYAKWGSKLGRSILGDKFPNGSARLDVEAIKNEMSIKTDDFDENSGLSIAQRLMKNLEAEYNAKKIAALFGDQEWTR